MTEPRSIALIGAGRMGSALARGLAAAGLPGERILVSDADAQAARRLADGIGARVAASNAEAVGDAEVVVLAVKPQVAKAAVQELAPALTERHALVSIAAGISVAQ
jgi:pyrroline-5-carboxylate reductase